MNLANIVMHIIIKEDYLKLARYFHKDKKKV